jgi:molybdopterin-guanine dinucleotide biosynthesis protein A
MNIGAVVLCGGESRRMGRPKATLPFGAECLLQRVVRLLAASVGPIVVVAAPDQELALLPTDVIIVRDQVRGCGPVQGFANGLARLPSSVEFVYATATDVPFLEPRWVDYLHELIGEHDLAIPYFGGHYQPLAALYRASRAGPALETLLRSSRAGLVFLVDSLKTRVVTEDQLRKIDPALRTLQNINTLEDYRRALETAGLSGG